jgi:adenylate cyclase
LLVILEDLHWIDAASSATLAELARDVVQRRCLVVSTSRTGWSPQWPCSTLALEPLGDDSARSLVESVVGTRLEDDLMQVILARTGGNPFFVEEVVRGLWDSGVLVERDGRVVVQPGATPRVPATIQEVLLSRLDRLPEGARSVVRPAAVCGRTFWKRVVGYVVKERPVTEGLATLEREQFVMRRPVPVEPSYAFRHALIQEVAYQTQLQSHRRTTHGAIGEAIETLFADRLDEFVNELAFHFGRSDNDPKALSWQVRAGDRARALYANQEALALYAGALERAKDGEGPFDAGAILERVGDVQALIGRNDEAIATFESARARIPDPRPGTAARLKRKVGTALRIKGAYEQAEGTLAAARSMLNSRLDIERAQIGLQVGQLNWRTGQYAAAREALSEAVEIASALDQDEVLAEGLKQLGNIPLHAGDPHEAVDLFKRSQAIYRRLEDIAGIAMARLNLGTAYGRLGRWDESLAELTSSLAQFERIGDQWHIAVVHNNLGELYRQRGEFASAIAAFEEAAAISREIGYASGVANALTGVGSARVESGYVEQGRADLLAAAAQFIALGRSMYMPHIHRFLASAELALGNLEAAATEASRSVEFARATNATHEEAMTRRVQAQIALARGDRPAALDLLRASRQTLAEVGEAGELARTEALLRDLETS